MMEESSNWPRAAQAWFTQGGSLPVDVLLHHARLPDNLAGTHVYYR